MKLIGQADSDTAGRSGYMGQVCMTAVKEVKVGRVYRRRYDIKLDRKVSPQNCRSR